MYSFEKFQADGARGNVNAWVVGGRVNGDAGRSKGILLGKANPNKRLLALEKLPHPLMLPLDARFSLVARDEADALGRFDSLQVLSESLQADHWQK